MRLVYVLQVFLLSGIVFCISSWLMRKQHLGELKRSGLQNRKPLLPDLYNKYSDTIKQVKIKK